MALVPVNNQAHASSISTVTNRGDVWLTQCCEVALICPPDYPDIEPNLCKAAPAYRVFDTTVHTLVQHKALCYRGMYVPDKSPQDIVASGQHMENFGLISRRKDLTCVQYMHDPGR